MPAWIEKRKDRILKKNPDMDESAAWAIATQQAHKLGKTPKGYGTGEGEQKAKKKYRKSKKEYRKTAAPLSDGYYSRIAMILLRQSSQSPDTSMIADSA